MVRIAPPRKSTDLESRPKRRASAAGARTIRPFPGRRRFVMDGNCIAAEHRDTGGRLRFEMGIFRAIDRLAAGG
jgi:hypothetical protein